VKWLLHLSPAMVQAGTAGVREMFPCGVLPEDSGMTGHFCVKEMARDRLSERAQIADTEGHKGVCSVPVKIEPRKKDEKRKNGPRPAGIAACGHGHCTSGKRSNGTGRQDNRVECHTGTGG
jgi:hypothetical protein